MDPAIEALFEEIESMDYGAAKLAKAEEAVRLADQRGLPGEAYEARLHVVEAGVFGGFPEKALVAFTWCASKTASDPETFPETHAAIEGPFLTNVDLLWAYKWMTMQIPWYPQLTRAQIDQTFEDMEERYRRHGLSLRPVHMQRARAAREMGDDEQVGAGHFRKFQWARRDRYADCYACELSFEVTWILFQGDLARALQVAAPIIEGERGCAEIPHHTYAMFLLPLVDTGELEQARAFHERGYPLVRDNRDFLSQCAEHLDYLVAVGDEPRAIELFGRHLPWALEARVEDRRFRYFLSGRALMDAMSASEISLSLPANHPLHDPGGVVKVEALRCWLEDEVTAIGARFDARNGNDRYARMVAAHPRLWQF